MSREPNPVVVSYRVSFAAKGKRRVKRDGEARKRREERQAQRVALAEAIERWVQEGRAESYADVARRLGVSTARVSQIVGRGRERQLG